MIDSESAQFWKVVSMNEGKFQTYVHPRATIDPSTKIGRNVKIWANANVLANVKIGDNVSIGACSEIGKGSVIGDNSRVSFGVFLPSNSKIGDHCFIGPSVTFTDDKNPVCGNTDYNAQPPVMEMWSSIGAGAVILPGVKIFKGSLVGAGSIVTKDVPPGVIVKGNPARIYEREKNGKAE